MEALFAPLSPGRAPPNGPLIHSFARPSLPKYQSGHQNETPGLRTSPCKSDVIGDQALHWLPQPADDRQPNSALGAPAQKIESARRVPRDLKSAKAAAKVAGVDF